MAQLLKALLSVSEKSANIARLWRQEETLFQMLIEEKTGMDKNKKFVQDFKTLADVLIQEVIKHDVGQKFPELKSYIGGEESNKFENGLGETIIVEVCKTKQETAGLLYHILDHSEVAAQLLADVIHQDVVIEDAAAETVTVNIATEAMGIWIDPIDSTNQYIKGKTDVIPIDGIYPYGLKSALVLIGVYDRNTGDPVIGIINEPFYQQDCKTLQWRGHYYWGISYNGTNISSVPRPEPQPSISVVLSSSENENTKQSLSCLCGRKMYYACGAGYKFLCLLTGHVDTYVFSEDTTFKWDSCAPHAILKALGGGILDLAGSLKTKGKQHAELPELKYNKPIQGAMGANQWANQGGLIAFVYRSHAEVILNVLDQVSIN
ncbi:inositol polyphosphate 1-phosphatase [Protopterus annectens]|uniref:inositol polyphosphate 1-phosphatase n=1 Tax=Protopterus annectens TaxID=7888 RepID=UPI001CFA424C|nr:inositol polyphosphate 1-phosphatase [Protopterus annectens]